jgi:hypothetical protein
MGTPTGGRGGRGGRGGGNTNRCNALNDDDPFQLKMTEGDDVDMKSSNKNNKFYNRATP